MSLQDMTPMQFWPHTSNSQGYVDARVIEHMWKERYEFLSAEIEEDDDRGMTVFPLILHPDTSGMAHVLPMIERFLKWVLAKGESVEFMSFGEAAYKFKSQ
jgi:hypothetical protein